MPIPFFKHGDQVELKGLVLKKIAWQLDLHAAAYNLVRMKNLGLGVT